MTDFVGGGLAGVGVSEFNCHSHRLRAPNPVRTDRMPRDLDTLSKDMRGVFCPSDSHHVLFFRIEDSLSKHRIVEVSNFAQTPDGQGRTLTSNRYAIAKRSVFNSTS
jgi:hypothetical protein